jgi:hypothetical protein
VNAEVWIIHKRRVVLVTDVPGVPVDAVVTTDGTIGGTCYPKDVFVGSYPLPAMGWGEARLVAGRKAIELGYAVEVN